MKMQQLEMVTNNNDNNDNKIQSDGNSGSFVQTVHPRKPPYKCSVCKKLGWQYIHRNNTRSGFRYIFTVHYNEPPIGKSKIGKPVYRTCQQNSRLYNSIEEAISTLNTKPRKRLTPRRKSKLKPTLEPKHIVTTRIDTTSKTIAKQKQKTKKKGFNCPQCNHRGRLNIANSKTGKFYVTHEKIEGEFWGSKPSTKRQKHYRHYLKLGTETEKAARCYKRK